MITVLTFILFQKRGVQRFYHPKLGDKVHLETDVLFKYVENILNKDKDPLSVDKLRAFGFRRDSMQFDNIDSALMALKMEKQLL